MTMDADIMTIARAALAEFGQRAADLMDKRAQDHGLAEEAEGAEVWRRVAEAVRDILRR